MRFTIITLVAVLALSQSVEKARACRLPVFVGDLKGLCEGKDIGLHTVKDLKKVLLRLESPTDGNKCSAQTKEALRELGGIVDDSNACTPQKASDIVNFAEKYLKNSGDNADSLPKYVAQFALAYGMQVSNVCKKHMVYKFAPEAYNKLEADDLSEIGYITDKQSPLARVLTPILNAGEIVLPSDLEAVLPGLDKKFMKVVDRADKLKRLQERCTKRLRPLYEPILLPIAQLTRAGFTYQDSAFKRDTKLLFWLKKRSQFWSEVVFLCESIKLVEVVGENDASEPETAAESALEPPEVESEKEAAERIEEETSRKAAAAREALYALPTIARYVPEERVPNKIIGHLDFSLKSTIKSYDANKDTTQRLQERILDRSFELFKMLAESGIPKPMLEKFFQGLVFKGRDNEKELEEAKEALMELMGIGKRTTSHKPKNHTLRVLRNTYLTVAVIIGLHSVIWTSFKFMLGHDVDEIESRLGLIDKVDQD